MPVPPLPNTPLIATFLRLSFCSLFAALIRTIPQRPAKSTRNFQHQSLHSLSRSGIRTEASRARSFCVACQYPEWIRCKGYLRNSSFVSVS
jgi:hypothetical protein